MAHYARMGKNIIKYRRCLWVIEITETDIKSQIKNKIHKVCTNLKHVYNPNGQIQTYLRPDLAKWAKEMASAGKKYFYTEPVNPNNRYGELRLCEPKYEYIVDNLTQEEYDVLKELLNGDNKI